MKKIDESAINSQTGMLSPSGVLQFLQDETKDTIEILSDAIIGDSYTYPDASNTALVLQGCNQYTGSSTYNIRQGVIKYNGELFYVPQANFNPTGTQQAVVVLVTSFNNVSASADPVLFTDGTSRNILQTRTMQVVAGSSASTGYICDYTALNYADEAKNYFAGSSGSANISTVSTLGAVTVATKNGLSIITAVVNAYSASGNRLIATIQINGTPLTNSGSVSIDLAGGSARAVITVQTYSALNRGDVVTLVADPSSTSTTIASWSLVVNQQFIR